MTDRFFIFRIFLFGESPLFRPGRLANAEEARCKGSGAPVPVCFSDLKDVLKLESGSIEVGDSGDELGDGSVRESMVEMVVVGEESVDSKVDVESLRNTGEEWWLLFGGLLRVFAILFAVTEVVLSNSLASCTLTPFPNTDMNDGKEASSGPEPVVPGILDL